MFKDNDEKLTQFLRENEDLRLEDLQCKNLKILQNKNLYTFTSDSVVLANFIRTHTNDSAVEIGAGSGVISILVQAKNPIKKIFAFEIQKQMADLARKNVEINNLQEKIEIIADDVKNFDKYIEKGKFEVVFSNPPYFKTTNFVQNEVSKIAKEEVSLSLEDLVKISFALLKDKGVFYCCHIAERSAELISCCQNNGLTVKEMFFTENGKGRVKLVVVKCVKGAKNGVKVYPNLITNEENGDYIATLHTKYFI